jgi:signal transduction histidine kinase
LPRLFEPFNTTKPKGSGLGLALARKNIEAFGGTVSYADRPGGGAIFTVSLPLGKPE